MKTAHVLALVLISALPTYALASGSHGHDKNAMEGMMDRSGHKHEDEHSDEHNDMAGQPGNPKNVSRTIEISMNDTMRFTPDHASIKAGDTVRFEVKNNGKLNHEMVIGTMDELKEHAEMMRKMPTMKHAEPNMLSLAPGKQGEIVWEFDKPGIVDFACLIPGHMEAGMKGEIKIQ